jgi:MinD-like ATPase involved in chromosome partitioning or flagellar assembly
MIQREKTLNKGLEEISHFFLSNVSPGEKNRKVSFNPFEDAVLPEKKKRILPFLSTCSNLPTSFFTCNLGLDLAHLGKEVFIVDIEKRQPNVESLFGLKPVSLGLSDILYPSESKIFRNVERHLRVLDVRLDLGSLPSPHRERDKRLVELLSREEALAEWVLINLPKSNSLVLQNTEWVSRINEVVIFMDSHPQNLIETYSLIKSLYAAKPDLIIYAGICEVGTVQEAKETFSKIQTGVEKFLGKSLRSVGYLLKDPLISQSIFEQIPIMSGDHPWIQKAMKTMARILVESDAPGAMFFSGEKNDKVKDAQIDNP